jgi:hypothetical protein
MLAALNADAESALAQADAQTVAQRDARRRADGAVAEAEARLTRLQDDFERATREAEARTLAEQAAREKAEAEASHYRQEMQSRRDRNLLARLRAAWRGE